MAVTNVADRGDAYGMPGVMYDGNDVLESYNVAVRGDPARPQRAGTRPAGGEDLPPGAPFVR